MTRRWYWGITGVVLGLSVSLLVVVQAKLPLLHSIERLTLGSRECRDFSRDIVTVGNIPFRVAMAKTREEQAQGLMGCPALPADAGMYFPYAIPTQPQFWMRGMVIPLDLIWITGGRIIGISAAVSPAGDDPNPPRYQPPGLVTGVLEIAAGTAAQQRLVPGVAVTVPY